MINYKSLSTYDYHLPEELIAQTPLEKRDESRLLVFDRKTKNTYQTGKLDISYHISKQVYDSYQQVYLPWMVSW